MPMNDGNHFLNNDGTIIYPPRGKDNPYFEEELVCENPECPQAGRAPCDCHIQFDQSPSSFDLMTMSDDEYNASAIKINPNTTDPDCLT